MTNEEHAKECQQQLKKLTGKKVVDSCFRAYDNNCWRLYIVTDTGKMVMTFCPDWSCPVVEHHQAHHEEESPE